MVLKVILDGVPWLADVGFGTSLPMPLRLDRIAPQATGHEVFRVFPFGTSHMVQIWRDDAWRSLYEVSTVPQYQADYELTNWFTSTHPASPFKRDLIVARVTPEARCTLLNNRLTLRPRNGDADILVLDAAGIEAALAEIFDLPVEPTWRPAIDAAAMR
jgi:N-hydroxyarylamine O-acetyltransferase